MSTTPPIAVIKKNTQDELRVTLDEFRGARLVDIRVFSTFTAANVPMPTKKGVAIGVGKIGDLIEALGKAKAEAEAMGWIGGEE
jgi:hypothetical protein